MATVTFLHSYSLSGDRGQHLLWRMSYTALHIGDFLAALLRTRRPGSPSCGPPGRALPESLSILYRWVAWGPVAFPLPLRVGMDNLSCPHAALVFSRNFMTTH
mgnify:CR=1 FL=1